MQPISEFVRGFSVEATRPTAADMAEMSGVLPPGTPVYVSAIPTRPPTEAIAGAALLRQAGFEPVPHIAARNFATAGALDEFLARAQGEAGVTRALVIAGDRDTQAGEFRDALEVIRSGRLQRHGIAGIGIAGYPDGHPRIAQAELERALADKIEAARAGGLGLHIVTQFGFDPEPILGWIGALRECGVDCPVRIGLAGPANLTTLLRFAQRCGVRASAHGLTRQAGLMRQLLGASSPDALVAALAEATADERFGEVAPHLFSFGGLGATARWAAMALAADGRVAAKAVGPRV